MNYNLPDLKFLIRVICGRILERNRSNVGNGFANCPTGRFIYPVRTHTGEKPFKCDSSTAIDLFRGACAAKGNVQVAGHVKPAPFSRRDVTLGDVDGSLFHIQI